MEVPETPEMVVEVRLQDRLVEFVVTARATVPAKPFREETAMIEVPATPALTVRLVKLADTERS